MPPDPTIPAPTPDPSQIPPLESRPRVVLRFAPEKELFVSGMLTGGSELAGKAAVVDVPVGRGHVVMFANNPMWRHETHGSFSMLFNATISASAAPNPHVPRVHREQGKKSNRSGNFLNADLAVGRSPNACGIL
jgi:hypothetical protein